MYGLEGLASLSTDIGKAIEEGRKAIKRLADDLALAEIYPEEIESEKEAEARRAMEALMGEAVTFEQMQEIKEDMGSAPDPVYLQWDRQYWKEAADLYRGKIEAAFRAFFGTMTNEKARQAMKHRKQLPSEVGFPDLRCCATCRHSTPLTKPPSPECCGCIQGGECTKWEDAGGEEYD